MFLRVLAFCIYFLIHFTDVKSQSLINIRPETLKLSDAFTKIEKFSNYRFFYNNEHVPINAIVNIKSGSITNILKTILYPLNLDFKIIDNRIIIENSLSKEMIYVKGTIKNQENEAIPYVSIKILNINKTINSNKYGNFEILVSKGSSIQFSHIDYITKVLIVSENNNDEIVLENDDKGINEVVIVGYGKQLRSLNTGSISTINTTEINQTPSPSLQNILSGKLSGFYSQQHSGMPGNDGAQFYVRGISTYNGDQYPLVMIDDIQFPYQYFQNIDPNEIEKITILKDAATTAIYGIKGANGVLLVTTKRGENGPLKIRFRTEFGLQQPTHVPKYLNAYQTAVLRNEALQNEGKAKEFSNESLAHFLNGTDPYGHPDNDWYNILFRDNSPLKTNNIDINGGTSKLQYMISLGYRKQEGLLKKINLDKSINNNYYYERYNFRSNLDLKPAEVIDLKIDFWGSFGERNSPNFHGNSGASEVAAFTEIARYDLLPPYIYPIYNPDGSWGTANPLRFTPLNSSNNIIGRIAHGGYSRSRENLINVNITPTILLDKILSGLILKSTLSISNRNESVRQILRRDFPSFYYDPNNQTYTPRDLNINRILPWENIYISGSPTQQINLQSSIGYSRKNSNHQFNGLLLFSQTSNLNASIEPIYNYIPENFRGYTIRLGYNYKLKYVTEINAAYNGTDQFPVNNRFGLFPAVSIGWNIAEETFFSKKNSFIDLLKLRFSYGLVGNDNIGEYRYNYDEVYIRNNPFSFGETHQQFQGISEGYLGNLNISWEKERKANLGIEYSFLKGKITGTLDIFKHFRYDILTPRNSIALHYGIQYNNSPPLNIGKVSNKGLEIELTYNEKISDIGISLKGNLSYAKNKIVEMDEVTPKYPWQQQTGHPIGTIRQWIFDGYYNESEILNPEIAKPSGNIQSGFLKYKDLNGDKIIDVFDKAYLGNPNLHNTNIGMNIGLSYKRFKFHVLLQSALNFDIQIGQYLSTPFAANLQPIHLKRWTAETSDIAEFPKLLTDFRSTYMNSQEASTFWNIKGDYLRVKSAELSFILPHKLVDKLNLESVRLYSNGYNLFIWSKILDKYQYDPEIAKFSNIAPYPQQSIYNFGFAISF